MAIEHLGVAAGAVEILLRAEQLQRARGGARCNGCRSRRATRAGGRGCTRQAAASASCCARSALPCSCEASAAPQRHIAGSGHGQMTSGRVSHERPLERLQRNAGAGPRRGAVRPTPRRRCRSWSRAPRPAAGRRPSPDARLSRGGRRWTRRSRRCRGPSRSWGCRRGIRNAASMQQRLRRGAAALDARSGARPPLRRCSGSDPAPQAESLRIRCGRSGAPVHAHRVFVVAVVDIEIAVVLALERLGDALRRMDVGGGDDDLVGSFLDRHDTIERMLLAFAGCHLVQMARARRRDAR